ncbi:protein-tyrosine sulfotransferase-like, partial [Raphanus sativus]|uniref:Protein-tyrosine sulfotransferase-like n=1 Tax=Raphanus sativus TaxID=3726 RepID=A0A9W3CUP9_RAPSA
FLRKLYDHAEECPRSYDKLHFDPRAMRSVDSSKPFPSFAHHPSRWQLVSWCIPFDFCDEDVCRIRNNNVISPLDIWPWKYLVPWMREDLFARRDARKLKGGVIIEDDNPYDMEEMLMPLHKYLDTPTAHDIIHNGATFQIAGLTNNSHLAEAHEVRHCVQKYKNLGEPVLQVAKVS